MIDTGVYSVEVLQKIMSDYQESRFILLTSTSKKNPPILLPLSPVTRVLCKPAAFPKCVTTRHISAPPRLFGYNQVMGDHFDLAVNRILIVFSPGILRHITGK